VYRLGHQKPNDGPQRTATDKLLYALSTQQSQKRATKGTCRTLISSCLTMYVNTRVHRQTVARHSAPSLLFRSNSWSLLNTDNSSMRDTWVLRRRGPLSDPGYANEKLCYTQS